MSPRLKLLLGLLALLLLAHVWRIRWGHRRPSAEVQSLPASLLAPAAAGARTDLFNFGAGVAVSKGLRTAVKSLPTPHPSQAVTTPAPVGPAWSLLGIVSRGEARLALLQPTSGGATVMAGPGQGVDQEWTLESLKDDGAVLRRVDGSRFTLSLLEAP